MANQTAAEIEARLRKLEIYRAYKRSKYLSVKHSSYFHVYETLLGRYRGTNLTFIEIGVLNGGSLFMWRDYFGPTARIIGVDANPGAKKWENDHFEIFIGDQSDGKFWDRLFSIVGDVDVVLDDGGHTNDQQIITTEKCIPHIRDGGILIVEDTHASYQKSFGNPSKYSFINYCKMVIDAIHSRFPAVHASTSSLRDSVSSIEIYESIVCFRIDRANCFVSSATSNEGISSEAHDFRYHGSILYSSAHLIKEKLPFLAREGFLSRAVQKIARIVFFFRAKYISRRSRKYFQ
jgi:hypothetical protein